MRQFGVRRSRPDPELLTHAHMHEARNLARELISAKCWRRLCHRHVRLVKEKCVTFSVHSSPDWNLNTGICKGGRKISNVLVNPSRSIYFCSWYWHYHVSTWLDNALPFSGIWSERVTGRWHAIINLTFRRFTFAFNRKLYHCCWAALN